MRPPPWHLTYTIVHFIWVWNKRTCHANCCNNIILEINLVTCWDLPRLHLPVKYITTNLVYPLLNIFNNYKNWQGVCSCCCCWAIWKKYCILRVAGGDVKATSKNNLNMFLKISELKIFSFPTKLYIVYFKLGQPFSGKICLLIFSSSLKNYLLTYPYCSKICSVIITLIKRFLEYNHMICNQIDFQSKDQCVQVINPSEI